MRKSLLYFVGASVCFLFGCSTAYANDCSAGMTHCTKHHYDFPPNLAVNGCSRLNVTIQNKTNYFLVWDNSYAADTDDGDIIDADSAEEVTSVVISPSPGQSTIVLQGVEKDSADKDAVNKALRFTAYLTNPVTDTAAKKTGAEFVIQVTKNSCNAALTTCQQKDHPCYCTSTTSGGSCVDAPTECDKAWYNDPYSNASNYEPLHSQDHYWDEEGATNCDKARQTSDLNVSADFSDMKAVYVDAYSKDSAHFACDKPAVCYASNDATENSPATINFTVEPALIETLTITFPFKTKTPMAKLMKDSIYGNLNAKYIGLLGSYFSYSPVVVGENTLAFSTLCNAASCP